MSFRDHVISVLEGLLSNIINGIFVAPIFFKLQVQPWVSKALRASRNAVIRGLAAVFALPSFLIDRLRAVPPSRNTLIVPPTGSLVINTGPEPMPPGTASSIAMAMQPQFKGSLTPLTFVNNSHWMQLEAAQRQHESAARFAM
jgi:hypothetical protein